MTYKVFICYRRVNKELARIIESGLGQEFGKDAVFLDIQDIHGGQKWKNTITKALHSNPVVVTLITTKWNSRLGGHPKLLDSDDYVRGELETALKLNLPIIPIVYERAYFPKEKQLPPSLHPLLNFQHLPFSMDRLEFDMGRLIKAVKDLLGEEPEKVIEKKGNETYSPPKMLFQNPTQNTPLSFQRSMFTLSPEKQKEYEERAKKEQERLTQARENSPAFYSLPAFWIAIVVTLLLSGGSVWGAEILAQSIGEEYELPAPPLIAGMLLAGIWTLVWVILGARSYTYDPDQGGKVFFTHGILGGWVLGYDGFEPVGYWSAFPLSTALLWLVARGLAMLGFHFLQWNYLLIFWIVLGAYTLIVAIAYADNADIEFA